MSELIKAYDVLEKIKKEEIILNNDELSSKIMSSLEKENWNQLEKINSGMINREQKLEMELDSNWNSIYLSKMNDLKYISKQIPPDTRLFTLKRVINKVLFLTNQFQEMLNVNIVNSISEVTKQINMLKERVVKNTLYIEESEKKLDKLQSDLSEQQTLFSTEKEKKDQGIQIIKQDLDKYKQQNEGIRKKSVGNENWLKVLDTRIAGDESWIAALSGRLDIQENAYKELRDELFYELQKSIKNLNLEKTTVKTKIKIKESFYKKLDQYSGVKKVNLGCGPQDLDGYINVDMRDLDNVDIVSSATELPFEKEELDEILSSHLIEHFTAVIMEKEVLPYWYSLLKKGGKIRSILPNISYMAHKYVENEISFEDYAEVISGGQEYEGNYHYAVYSTDKLCKLLEKVGFQNIKVITEGRKNGKCWEMEVVAQK